MADDGLVINFDLGDGPFVTPQSFKGGSWKDRLTARKAAQYNRSKHDRKNVPREAGANDEFPDSSRPAKRSRVNDEAESQYRGQQRRSVRANTSEKRTQGDGKAHQVISSLFSFNPAPTTAREGAKEPEELVEPSNAPLTSELDTFTSLGLSAPLAEHLLVKLGIKAPTAIQRAAVTQLVKEDNDAFIQAQTGSGKTLAYLLPIVQRIMSLSAIKDKSAAEAKEGAVHRDSGLFAIIIAPTRELSKQIAVVLESLLRCAHWIVSGIVIGGEKKKSEKARLRKGLNILIATPGRLADHLDHTEVLDVSNVRWVVLDEGDRLMELGFEKDIEKILSTLNVRASKVPTIEGLPKKRTTILCSATMKMDVQKLGEMSLKDAIHIQGDSSAGEEQQIQQSFSAPAQLQQAYAIVPAKLRLVALTALLKRTFARKGSVMKAIVFMSCADSVDFHFDLFSSAQDIASTSTTPAPSKETKSTTPAPSKEIKSTTPSSQGSTTTTTARTTAPSPTLSTPTNPTQIFKLHGSLPQSLRTSTLSSFTRSANASILFCTDVASRGLDLPNIDFVIEYDPPFAREDHLHRIGRTARAGRDGRAMIFLQPGAEEGYVNVLKESRAQGSDGAARGVTRYDAEELLRRGFGSTGIGGGKDWEERATEWQLAVERQVLEDAHMLEMARRAFQSHVRSYATHVASERDMFDITALHLGHLAKAFGLRDRPGNMRVPGKRVGKEDVRAARRAGGRRAAASAADGGKRKSRGDDGAGAGDVPGEVDVRAAMRMMRQKARMAAAGASEFNIG